VADSTLKQGGQSDHTIRRATSNMTQTCPAPVTRTQFIDSEQATYCLWSMHTCRCPNNGLPGYTRSIAPRPWPLYWWTHSLKIK
jgi:hypothetical protein